MVENRVSESPDPTFGVPVCSLNPAVRGIANRAGEADSIKMTPDLFFNILRAAVRAVRSWVLVHLLRSNLIGRVRLFASERVFEAADGVLNLAFDLVGLTL